MQKKKKNEIKKKVALIIRFPSVAIPSFLNLKATNLQVLPVEKLHKTDRQATLVFKCKNKAPCSVGCIH